MESVVWVFTVVLALQCGGVVGGNDVTDMDGGMNYLHRYGYVGMVRADNNMTRMDSDQTRRAIMMFQRFANLNMTGVMDDATMEKMSEPRCGVPDMNGTNSLLRRRRRYALLGSRWLIKDITYRITGYTQKLARSIVDNDIREGFKVWSDNSNLKFRQVESSDEAAHITMFFAPDDHGDRSPFDGPAGVLAHALPPAGRGETHFDDDETWTTGTFSGINLLQVAAHEFGHALGLGHSDVEEALMAPFYRGYKENFQLHSDDIQGIQILYGRPEVERPVVDPGAVVPQAPVTTPPPRVTVRAASKPPTPSSATQRTGAATAAPGSGAGPVPDRCAGYVDAITQAGGKTYAFRGGYFWELTRTGVAGGYPRKISENWSGLPNNLDGALYTREDRKTYFFKGGSYWRFSGRQPDNGYPKPIREGFKGVPDNIDAAFQWSGNGKIYFTKGDKYYRYDFETGVNTAMYPQSLSRWTGLPTAKVDAAFQWINGKTYFFKAHKTWLFDDLTMEVNAFYPQFTSTAWFGCRRGGGGGPPNRSDWIRGQPIIVVVSLVILQMSVMLSA
ncbi:PREDICTED: matrix metalloproteinase-16-like [Branchiostoma belcheri]|uniref:Matrix metalloproteinase-16-like n=1 Tax=Branchiostoma belcheri TaxID=7741 RepID=A0A6P5A7P8_BRABE|nr:PREDICTED: matrix metalloproteinase-16-like [Branchiostoma belcheri]